MKFSVLSIYKDFIDDYKKAGVIGRACTAGIIQIDSYDIRDYSSDRHKAVDDYPYGGGAGMVMTPQPVADCIKDVKGGRDIPVIFFTPRGRKFDSKTAKEYSQLDEVILLCGHFEGIDERAVQLYADDEISMGDYIVTGGHISAVCFIDSTARYVKGVLGNEFSSQDESFENGLLEYEQYTRPAEFEGMTVPEVLMSGNHKLLSEYKEKRSLELTAQRRPDLYEEYLKKKDPQ